MNSADVLALVSSFSDPTDGAAEKSRELIQLLLECSPSPFSRDHFTPGHITCTGMVLAPDCERVLVIHHRRLDRWLLPGGHVEPEDAEIWDAARREVVEETGATLLPGHALAGMDVHGIPAGKGEPYHLHHDILFYFRATSDRLVLSHESRDIAWAAPAEFESYGVPHNIRCAYVRMRKLS